MGTGIAKYDGESAPAHMAIHGNLRQIVMVSVNNLASTKVKFCKLNMIK